MDAVAVGVVCEVKGIATNSISQNMGFGWE